MANPKFSKGGGALAHIFKDFGAPQPFFFKAGPVENALSREGEREGSQQQFWISIWEGEGNTSPPPNTASMFDRPKNNFFGPFLGGWGEVAGLSALPPKHQIHK